MEIHENRFPITIENTAKPDEKKEQGGKSSEDYNFNTYNNKEQQETEDAYVLNTNKKTIHIPSCSSVPKIKPENYDTSNLSIPELEAAGYKRCGNCLK